MLGHRHPRVASRCAGAPGTPSARPLALLHMDVLPPQRPTRRTNVRTFCTCSDTTADSAATPQRTAAATPAASLGTTAASRAQARPWQSAAAWGCRTEVVVTRTNLAVATRPHNRRIGRGKIHPRKICGVASRHHRASLRGVQGRRKPSTVTPDGRPYAPGCALLVSGYFQNCGRGTVPSATSMNKRTVSSEGIAPGKTIINVAMSCIVRFARPHRRAFHMFIESDRRSRRANSSCATPLRVLKSRTANATTFCVTAARNFDTANGGPAGSGGNHLRPGTSSRPNDSLG